jgi:hypothetical protein
MTKDSFSWEDLRTLGSEDTDYQASQKLNISVLDVKRARALVQSRSAVKGPWEHWEDALLVEMYHFLGLTQVAFCLRREVSDVTKRYRQIVKYP